MKRSILFILFTIFLNFYGYGQVYFGTSEVTLSSKFNNMIVECFSNKLSTYMNLERNELTYKIEFASFDEEGEERDTMCFYGVFNVQSCPSLYIVLLLPFNKLDKDYSGKQTMNLTGSLTYCNRAYPITVMCEFEYLDKLLLYDFSLNIDASSLSLILPKGMDNIIRMHTDNGKLIVRKY